MNDDSKFEMFSSPVKLIYSGKEWQKNIDKRKNDEFKEIDIKNFENKKVLKLFSTELIKDDIFYFSLIDVSSLIELTLSFNNLGDESLEILSKYKCFKIVSISFNFESESEKKLLL